MYDRSNLKKICYQGIQGAYSHDAVKKLYPDAVPMACDTFADALLAVSTQKADGAFLPFENNKAGGVREMHTCLPDITGLHIAGDIWIPIHHALVAATEDISRITHIYSHPQALAQCDGFIEEMGVHATEYIDTAAAAQFVKQQNDPTKAAICSEEAARIYGMHVLAREIQDNGESAEQNLTRFFLWQAASNQNALLTKDIQKARVSAYYLKTAAPHTAEDVWHLMAQKGFVLVKKYGLNTKETKNNTEFYAEFTLPKGVTPNQLLAARDDMERLCSKVVWFGCF